MDPMSWSWLWRSTLIVGLLIAFSVSATGTKNKLHKFFCSVDRDGDGEIEQHEATKFLSKFDASEREDDNSWKEDAALYSGFSYGGKTICSEEMMDHLQYMLTADKVVSWVEHGLQLPQYADAFHKNAINGMDFLSLIEDDGRALAEDLGVSSALHRKKITSALVRQIFGFGTPPGPPREMQCQSSTCGGIQLNWRPPATSGYPPLHKYVVYRWSAPLSSWILVADTKETSFFDKTDLIPGKRYSYRIQAWGGHGPSEWVTVNNCTTSARPIQLNFVSKNAVAAPVAGDVKALNLKAQQRDTTSKDAESTSWGWIFSLNTGLFLLAFLSRLRISLAAWVVFKKFLRRAISKIYAAESSNNACLRTIARAVVPIFGACISLHAKISVLARQAAGVRSPVEERLLSHSDSFRGAIGYSTPDCTMEEMIAAVQKLHVARTKYNSISERGYIEELDLRSSELDVRALSAPAAFDGSEGSRNNFLREVEVSTHRRRTRHKCNYDGCKNRFDRWWSMTDMRMRFRKHYCRECQRVFCVTHTRISPHGAAGRCGLDSTCVCLSCFNNLTSEIQERLERINKLRVGPPAQIDSSDGSSTTRDPFPPDFSTLRKGLYLNRDSSSSGSLSSSSNSSRGTIEEAKLQ